nr:MAG TPA: hypothetical protein [Caudoviricetes sp.]DAT69705.1 MAG TPA: hypothetical protein [Caudoviricetes sp.]
MYGIWLNPKCWSKIDNQQVRILYLYKFMV